jgi:uncharacterized glyoxalase superfamily protein PhnB
MDWSLELVTVPVSDVDREGLQIVVHDIEAARAQLVERGLEVTEVQDYPWGRFVFLKDPDGNGWSIQQPPGT